MIGQRNGMDEYFEGGERRGTSVPSFSFFFNSVISELKSKKENLEFQN